MIYWCMVDPDRPEDLDVAIRNGLWGVPEEALDRIEPVEPGDGILFYHRDHGVLFCEVDSEPYTEKIPVWRDADYPHRVRISDPLETDRYAHLGQLHQCLHDLDDGEPYASPDEAEKALAGLDGAFRPLTEEEARCVFRSLGWQLPPDLAPDEEDEPEAADERATGEAEEDVARHEDAAEEGEEEEDELEESEAETADERAVGEAQESAPSQEDLSPQAGGDEESEEEAASQEPGVEEEEPDEGEGRADEEPGAGEDEEAPEQQEITTRPDRRDLLRIDVEGLREHLFGERELARCALCGRLFPVRLLAMVFVKDLSACTRAETRDVRNNVLPACRLGCEVLFREGFVVVEEGVVEPGRQGPLTEPVEDLLEAILGNRCEYWHAGSAAYFRWHARRARGGG